MKENRADGLGHDAVNGASGSCGFGGGGGMPPEAAALLSADDRGRLSGIGFVGLSPSHWEETASRLGEETASRGEALIRDFERGRGMRAPVPEAIHIIEKGASGSDAADSRQGAHGASRRVRVPPPPQRTINR